MTKAEEAALKALPPRWRKTKDGKGKIDSVLPVRKAYIRAYEQAEKDLLSKAVDAEIVRDIHNLLHIKSDVLPMPSEYKFGDKVKIIILPREYK